MSQNFYSFTFTIPPQKKVYYGGKRRIYSSMNHKAQSNFLNDLIIKTLPSSKFLFYEWVFEEHKEEQMKGNLHIHGFCSTSIEDAEAPIREFQRLFYTHNQIIGLKLYHKLSDIQKTLTNISHWKSYMAKHQDEMLYKMPLLQQNEDINHLDNGIIKVEHNPNTPISEYPDDYWKTYRFKGHNKFMVDL